MTDRNLTPEEARRLSAKFRRVEFPERDREIGEIGGRRMTTSNRPTIEHHLTPSETSYLMDLLHDNWARRVATSAVASIQPAYDDHVWRCLKARASRLINKLDDNAYKQGFWEDGKGL